MNSTTITSQKRVYSFPLIEKVVLDNEISLVLESDPPTFESLNKSTVHEYFNLNSFKSDKTV